ncbi:hypothetical protein IMAU40088_00710 [Lactobacillus helveticus]|uniref:Uncharacterized protein n=1 Tax=Lactobacillus helveticus TaxID=1587 RepID=A0A3Q8ST75_LACHE|nr:hypothetical protein LH5_00318 [Lactobacillus helveticus]NRO64042.1 hypothetical protein [Lactobacillus helveticus]
MELKQIFETNQMFSTENLDVRTITMGISLLDCIDSVAIVLVKKFMIKSRLKLEI